MSNQKQEDIFDRLMHLPILRIFEPFYLKYKEVLLYTFFGGLAFFLNFFLFIGIDHFFAINPSPDLWLATTKAPRDYSQAQFRPGCWLMFGKETAGLPADLRWRYRERCLRIPMRPDARILNLANSVAILTYEALRQQGFPDLSGVGEMGEEH